MLMMLIHVHTPSCGKLRKVDFPFDIKNDSAAQVRLHRNSVPTRVLLPLQRMRSVRTLTDVKFCCSDRLLSSSFPTLTFATILYRQCSPKEKIKRAWAPGDEQSEKNRRCAMVYYGTLLRYFTKVHACSAMMIIM